MAIKDLGEGRRDEQNGNVIEDRAVHFSLAEYAAAGQS